MTWVTIGIFGLLGIFCRWSADIFLQKYNYPVPISTLGVNLLGCLMAGLIFTLSQSKSLISPTLATGLIVGFCGGLTTFSAYSLQAFNLLSKGRIGLALGYLLLSPIVGILAAYLGTKIAEQF